MLAELTQDEIPLDGDGGAVLEKNCVYVVELLESLEGLPATISAFANPKSSTGSADVHPADRRPGRGVRHRGGRLYRPPLRRDLAVELQHPGAARQPAEPAPLPAARLRPGRRRRASASRTGNCARSTSARPLADGKPAIRNGLLFSIHLAGAHDGEVIGFEAQRFTDVVDVDRVGEYAIDDFWRPLSRAAKAAGA